jgi:NAD(P)-dependent dehydrogenase (short-subunit alcohol dehydrogenase family)
MSDPLDNLLPSLSKGFRAVVVGASGGIGVALCQRLRQQANLGYLSALSRSESGLDLVDEKSIAKAAREVEGPIHLLICATGALTIDGIGPEKTLRRLDPEAMLAQFRTNAVGPALVAKHFLPLLDRGNRSIALFLSARVGSIGDNHLGGWISYRSSKSALNQIVRTASIEMARTHPSAVVAAIHPGTVQTRLSGPYSSGHSTVSPEQAASNILSAANGITSTGVFVAYDGRLIEW